MDGRKIFIDHSTKTTYYEPPQGFYQPQHTIRRAQAYDRYGTKKTA